MRRRRWVLLAYVALSLLLTWPLATHFATHVPGDGIDDPALAWNLWWIKHSLVDQPQNPFACNWIFWPVGINLAFYTLTILNGLLSVPLQVTVGLVPAYNLLLLSSFALGGYGAYLLCRAWLGAWFRPMPAHGAAAAATPAPASRRAASPLYRTFATWGPFLGGAFYAFASAKLFYAALGQGNIASSQWIPFAVLYILRTVRPAGRPRDAALAALFLALQAYAELTYASFLLVFVGLAALWGLGRAWRGRRLLLPLVARLALLGALSGAGISPFLANMWPDLRAEGDFFTSGGGFSDVFSADLAGYALPTQLHPLLGGIIRAAANNSAPRPDGTLFAVDKGQQIYIGYVAFALAIAGLVAGARRARLTTGHGHSAAVFGVTPSAARAAGPKAGPWPALRPGAGPADAIPLLPGPVFWAVSSALFFLLTLGPSLRLAGHDLGLPLPFVLVAQLPFFKGNRYPSRYSVMLLMSLAPLVAAGAAHALAWAGRRWATRRSGSGGGPPGAGQAAGATPAQRASFASALAGGVLLCALLFEHVSAPLPLFDLRVPDIYRRVAADAGDFALLEMPPGWRNGARVAGKTDIVIMQEQWYQTLHGKRLLGGNTSRNPEFKFQYFSEDPTLARLIALTNAADVPQDTALAAALAAQPVTDADRTRARAWAAFLNLRYVMVHRDKLPAAGEATLRSLLPVQLVAAEGSLALYRLPTDLAAETVFDVGTDAGRLALAEGWSPPETASAPVSGAGAGAGETGSPASAPVYAERAATRLLLPLGPGATSVRFYGWSFAPSQKITLVIDGRALPSQPVPGAPGGWAFDVPPDGARPALSDVRLRFAGLVPVAQVAAGPYPVGQTGRSSLQPLLVRSAGQETGDFAHIYVGGVDVAPGGRGYNLVALDPAGRRAPQPAVFDTHAGPGAGGQMAAWLRALPQGALVAGAVRDEASLNLNEEAVSALRGLGVSTDLRGRFRWGHAFIGAVGAPPGSALEATDGVRPAQVSAGLPVSGPQVAAALVRVVVGPAAR